jgi:hypothetical protein
VFSRGLRSFGGIFSGFRLDLLSGKPSRTFIIVAKLSAGGYNGERYDGVIPPDNPRLLPTRTKNHADGSYLPSQPAAQSNRAFPH